MGFLTMALAEAVAERCGFWLKVSAQAAVLPLYRRQISRVTQEKHIVLTWLLAVYSGCSVLCCQLTLGLCVLSVRYARFFLGGGTIPSRGTSSHCLNEGILRSFGLSCDKF